MIILPLSIVYIRNHTKVISTTKPICIDNSAYFPQQTKPIYSNLCFLSNFAMLSIKDTFAYFQKQLCLLANIFKFNNGY